MAGLDEKACVICLQVLPLDHFHKDRAKKDGLRGHCKTCSKTVRRAYYVANCDEYKAKMRAYHAQDHVRLQRKDYGRQLRRDAIEHYGTQLQAGLSW